MGYLIPFAPQAFVNRISSYKATNIKSILYQLYIHFTIPINIKAPHLVKIYFTGFLAGIRYADNKLM